jgi:hypothetical protein
MSAFVEAIAARLTAAGVSDGGWPVDKLGAQATPDQSITIYETGGQEPIGKDRRVRRPSFQVVTRAGPTSRKAASDKAHASLLALDQQVVSGFGMFMATQSAPISLGVDERGRPLFAVNFRAMEA